LGRAHQVVEDQQAIEDDSLRIGVLRVHPVQRLSHIAEGFKLSGRRAKPRQTGIERQRLGREFRASEEHNTSVSYQRTLVLSPDYEQGVELRTDVAGVHAQADEDQLLVRL